MIEKKHKLDVVATLCTISVGETLRLPISETGLTTSSIRCAAWRAMKICGCKLRCNYNKMEEVMYITNSGIKQ